MKDEIKEILDFKEDIDYKRLSVDEIVILKDYIINLQESEAYYYGQYKDYKSRCEKANKFINKYCIDDEFYINLSYKEKAIIEVKKILQGSGNNDNK